MVGIHPRTPDWIRISKSASAVKEGKRDVSNLTKFACPAYLRKVSSLWLNSVQKMILIILSEYSIDIEAGHEHHSSFSAQTWNVIAVPASPSVDEDPVLSIVICRILSTLSIPITNQMSSASPQHVKKKSSAPTKGQAKLSPSKFTFQFDKPLVTKYAAGILPLAYKKNDETNKREWFMLLCVEWRSLEDRLCVHPLAGKKDEADQDFATRTATREFNEETCAVYSDVNLLERTEKSASQHHLAYFPSSKMYLFHILIPYRENINTDFLLAKQKVLEKTPHALIWYPIDKYLEAPSKVVWDFQDKIIEPSECSKVWFSSKQLIDNISVYRSFLDQSLEAILDLKDVTIQPPASFNSNQSDGHSSTSAISPISEDNLVAAGVQDLEKALKCTQISSVPPAVSLPSV